MIKRPPMLYLESEVAQSGHAQPERFHTRLAVALERQEAALSDQARHVVLLAPGMLAVGCSTNRVASLIRIRLRRSSLNDAPRIRLSPTPSWSCLCTSTDGQAKGISNHRRRILRRTTFGHISHVGVVGNGKH